MVVVGAVATTPEAGKKHLQQTGATVEKKLLPMAALLGTIRALQKGLETRRSPWP